MREHAERLLAVFIVLGQGLGWCGFFLSLLIDDTKTDTEITVRLIVISISVIILSGLLAAWYFRQKEKSAQKQCEFFITLNYKFKPETDYAKEFKELYERYCKKDDLQSSAKK